MRSRRARSPVGARALRFLLAAVVLVLLVAPPALATPLLSASHSAFVGAAPHTYGGAQLPCMTASNVSNDPSAARGNWAYCIAALNTESNPPTVQYVDSSNDSAANAMVLSLASTPKLELEWWCGGPTPTLASSAVLSLTVLGLNVIQDTISLSSTQASNYSECAPGVPLSDRTSIQPMKALDSFAWLMSGVYLGTVSFYDTHQNLIGNSTSFYVKVLPAYPPITIFTLPLMLVVLYEIYQTVRDFRDLQRARPARRPKPDSAAAASEPATASATTSPAAGAAATPFCSRCGKPTTFGASGGAALIPT